MDPYWTCNVYGSWLIWILHSSQSHPKQPGSRPAHTLESMAIFRQFVEFAMDTVDCNCWNLSLAVFYGSILSMSCVAEHAWALFHLFYPKHTKNNLGLASVPKVHKEHGNVETLLFLNVLATDSHRLIWDWLWLVLSSSPWVYGMY
jgi:hypothetical protein